jgi:hypothetical protein
MDPGLHLLRVKMEGQVNWREISEYLATIQKLFPEAPDAILDVSALGPTDIKREHVMELARGPKIYRRVAIVTSQPSQFGMARMYQLAAEVQPRRKISRVVSSEAEALEWLRGERTAVAQKAG